MLQAGEDCATVGAEQRLAWVWAARQILPLQLSAAAPRLTRRIGGFRSQLGQRDQWSGKLPVRTRPS